MKNKRVIILALVIVAVVIIGIYIVTRPTPVPTPTVKLEDIQIVEIKGAFRKDDRWRCEVVINLTNNAKVKVHVPSIYMKAINVTYVDGSYEELDIKTNATVNYEIEAGQSLPIPTVLTEYGFDKKPRTVWMEVEIYILEAKGRIVATVSIKE